MRAISYCVLAPDLRRGEARKEPLLPRFIAPTNRDNWPVFVRDNYDDTSLIAETFMYSVYHKDIERKPVLSARDLGLRIGAFARDQPQTQVPPVQQTVARSLLAYASAVVGAPLDHLPSARDIRAACRYEVEGYRLVNDRHWSQSNMTHVLLFFIGFIISAKGMPVHHPYTAVQLEHAQTAVNNWNDWWGRARKKLQPPLPAPAPVPDADLDALSLPSSAPGLAPDPLVYDDGLGDERVVQHSTFFPSHAGGDQGDIILHDGRRWEVGDEIPDPVGPEGFVPLPDWLSILMRSDDELSQQ